MLQYSRYHFFLLIAEYVAVFQSMWSYMLLGHCGVRPGVGLLQGARLRFSGSDTSTLHIYLHDDCIIDAINDHFLSRLLFTVREHSNIVNTSMDKESKLSELLETIQRCADSVFGDFCEILKHIELEHVLGKLERKVKVDLKVKQRQKRKSQQTTGESSDLVDFICDLSYSCSNFGIYYKGIRKAVLSCNTSFVKEV